MNHIPFNRKRFLLYLRKDWNENYPSVLLHALLSYLLMAFLFIWIDWTKHLSVSSDLDKIAHGVKPKHNNFQTILDAAAQGIDISWDFIGITAVFCLMFFLCFSGSTFFHTCKYRKDHIRDLTLPASDAEKAVARWLRITAAPLPLFLLAAVLADWTRIGFMRLLYPELSLAFPMPWMDGNHAGLPTGILESYTLQSLFILGATYWQKKPFQKTLSCVLALSLVFYFTYFCNVYYLIGAEYALHDASSGWYWGWTYGLLVFLLVFGYALAYLRMRRATLLPSWRDGTTLALLIVVVAGLGLCLWMPHFIVAH